MDRLLPVGTVIKNNNNLFMIVGYFPINDQKISVYSAVKYPIGFMKDFGFFYFNHNECEVVSIGYDNAEIEKFGNQLCSLLLEVKEKMEKQTFD